MDPQINEYEDNVDWYTGSGEKAHIQLIHRQITHNNLNSFMAIWKTLKRLHHKSTYRRVAVFKKHVSFWLVSRVPEAIFRLLELVLSMAWLSHPLIENPAKSRGQGRKGKRKGKSSYQKDGKSSGLGTPGISSKPQTSRSESRPPMSKKRPTETGVSRGGPHHAARPRPQCTLCRKRRHRASECPDEREATTSFWGKRALGTCALHCAVLDSPCYGTAFEQIEQDQDEGNIAYVVPFSIKSLEGFAISGGGGITFWIHDCPISYRSRRQM